MKVGIVAQRGNPRAVALAGDIRAALDATVVLDEATAADLAVDDAGTAGESGSAANDSGSAAGPAGGVPVDEMADCDLVVSIGGDGTFLFAARGAGTAPVMGVNLGEVGFLNAVSPADAGAAVLDAVERFRETGHVRAREVPRLRAEGGQEWSLTPALNEVVVQGPERGHGQGVDVEVRIDGSLYAASHADGVLVSTPTGSTAYNMSERGPLVHPGVSGFVVNGMSTADPMPPLLVAPDAEVTVRVDGAREAWVSSDGATRQRVEVPEIVTLTRAPEPARVAGPASDFFQALNKLE